MRIIIDLELSVTGGAVLGAKCHYDLEVTERHGMYMARSNDKTIGENIVGLDKNPRGAALDYVLQDVSRT